MEEPGPSHQVAESVADEEDQTTEIITLTYEQDMSHIVATDEPGPSHQVSEYVADADKDSIKIICKLIYELAKNYKQDKKTKKFIDDLTNKIIDESTTKMKRVYDNETKIFIDNLTNKIIDESTTEMKRVYDKNNETMKVINELTKKVPDKDNYTSCFYCGICERNENERALDKFNLSDIQYVFTGSFPGFEHISIHFARKKETETTHTLLKYTILSIPVIIILIIAVMYVKTPIYILSMTFLTKKDEIFKQMFEFFKDPVKTFPSIYKNINYFQPVIEKIYLFITKKSESVTLQSRESRIKTNKNVDNFEYFFYCQNKIPRKKCQGSDYDAAYKKIVTDLQEKDFATLVFVPGTNSENDRLQLYIKEDNKITCDYKISAKLTHLMILVQNIIDDAKNEHTEQPFCTNVYSWHRARRIAAYNGYGDGIFMCEGASKHIKMSFVEEILSFDTETCNESAIQELNDYCNASWRHFSNYFNDWSWDANIRWIKSLRNTNGNNTNYKASVSLQDALGFLSSKFKNAFVPPITITQRDKTLYGHIELTKTEAKKERYNKIHRNQNGCSNVLIGSITVSKNFDNVLWD